MVYMLYCILISRLVYIGSRRRKKWNHIQMRRIWDLTTKNSITRGWFLRTAVEGWVKKKLFYMLIYGMYT